MRLIFFSKYSEFVVHIKDVKKIETECLASEIIAFEFPGRNFPDSDENTCLRKSMCKQTVLRFQI